MQHIDFFLARTNIALFYILDAVFLCFLFWHGFFGCGSVMTFVGVLASCK